MCSSTQNALFAYGTLQHPRIMAHVLGRMPETCPAVLNGFARYRMKEFDFPGIVPDNEQNVDGTLFTGITQQEWDRLDTYEADFYERLEVTVCTSGLTPAFAYVVSPAYRHHLSTESWQLKNFIPGPQSGIR